MSKSRLFFGIAILTLLIGSCEKNRYAPLLEDLGQIQMDLLFVSETYGVQTILGVQDTTFGDLYTVVAYSYGLNGILDPTFSKDGRKIAFTDIIVAFNGGYPFHTNIYIYNMDSLKSTRAESFLTRVTYDSFGFDSAGVPFGTLNIRPDWSPTRPEVAFISDRGGRFDIYRVTLTDTLFGDTARVRLTDDNDSLDIYCYPAFSPDGNKIVFTNKKSGNEEIWVMNRDGSGKQQLTNLGAFVAGRPRYSPSGDKISFYGTSDPVGSDSLQIFIMNPDGSGITRVTSKDNNVEPAWSPDGTEIVYSKRPTSSRGYIYIIGRDGQNERRLVKHDRRAAYPIWRSNP